MSTKRVILNLLEAPSTGSTPHRYLNYTAWENAYGQLHRLDGPAIEWADGTKEWYVDGKLHRLDGPAIECADGTKAWWVDGKRHRLDGPAIEHADGTKAWYVDGKQIPIDRQEDLLPYILGCQL